MKIPKMEKHYERVVNLKKKLNDMATTSFPFEQAARLASGVVQKWLGDSPSRFSKETDGGGVYSWSQGGGWKVAHNHCVKYVMFHYSGKGRTLIGLGYDFCHWVLDGNAEQIPWRIWFSAPDVPDGVKARILDKQDDFALDGKNPLFVLVPKKYLKGLKRLPIEDEDEYVMKLAKAVEKFLDDLYTK
jgi:hypothetical protein